jgi:hypothetical protein
MNCPYPEFWRSNNELIIPIQKKMATDGLADWTYSQVFLIQNPKSKMLLFNHSLVD